MITISKIPEEQLSNYLDDAGLLSPVSGSAISVQLFEYTEPKSSSTPVVCIRSRGGGSGDNDVRDVPITIFLISPVVAKVVDYRIRAEEILNATLTTGAYEDIISMQSVGGILGPFRTKSDRLVFEIPLTVLFSN